MMDGSFLEKEVHEEFAKRMEADHERIEQRIQTIEDSLKETRKLTLSVERLALSVESMVKVQEAQGKRLETLESRDGEMWRKVVGYIVTSVVGIIVGYIFTRIGMN
jgi:hypothetical protein